MGRGPAVSLLIALTAACAAGAQPFPDDPYDAPYEWYGPVLGLPQAWGYSLGSTGVTVAVLDTGVIATAPDLAGRVLAPLSATGGPALDGTAKHHGTWVASVAAMGVNNGLGGAGVGNFSILPITVTDIFGNNQSEWIAEGIRMAADHGARAINVSYEVLYYSDLEAAAVYARQKGALVFVSSGNANIESLMTDYEHLVFVSGTDANGQRWQDPITGKGSTWGPFVDLAAPAADIVVVDPSFKSGYGVGSGTSYAAPFAAGAAALAWSINPDLTPGQVLDLLYGTAVDMGDPEVYGHGLLNVAGVAAGAYATITPEPATLALVLGGLGGMACLRRARGRRQPRGAAARVSWQECAWRRPDGREGL
jgi:subtilisin family serine protease